MLRERKMHLLVVIVGGSVLATQRSTEDADCPTGIDILPPRAEQQSKELPQLGHKLQVFPLLLRSLLLLRRAEVEDQGSEDGKVKQTLDDGREPTGLADVLKTNRPLRVGGD